MIREYTINNEQQVLMYLNTNMKPNKVDEVSNIALNKWAWNDDLGYHYNCGTGFPADFLFQLGKLNEGDKVDVYAEVYVLSGSTPQITFNNPGVSTINYTSDTKELKSGFNIIKLSCYNDLFAFRTVTVGVKANGIGEGYIRNVRVVITPKKTNLPPILVPIVIRNTAKGVYEEWTQASNNLSNIEVDTANNQLKLTLKHQVDSNYYLRPVTTLGNDLNDNGVIVKHTQITYSDIIVKFYNRSDNTLININDVPAYTYAHILLAYQSKDHDWLG